MMIDRNFQTKTGGLANMEVSMAFFPPTMCGWTNNAKKPTFRKATECMATALFFVRFMVGRKP